MIDGSSLDKPFQVSVIEYCNEGILRPHKVLWLDSTLHTVIVIRTDTYPLLWVWYWCLIRVLKTLSCAQYFVDAIVWIWRDDSLEGVTNAFKRRAQE